MSKVRVYEFGVLPTIGSIPHKPSCYHLRKAQAKDLVSRGLATWLTPYTLQLTSKATPSLLKCGQALAYERAGAAIGSQYCQGGLSRTEHKPAKFSLAKAARVGR